MPRAGIRARAETVRAVYEAEYANVAGYAYMLVRDVDTARDIAQEAFVRLLAHWAEVREPRAWLFRVATNLARDCWRANSRDRALVALLPPAAIAAADPDVEVHDAVQRLPRPHRDVVCLYYFADLPVPSVAAALGRPEGSVKRWLSEAREMLSATLGGGPGA